MTITTVAILVVVTNTMSAVIGVWIGKRTVPSNILLIARSRIDRKRHEAETLNRYYDSKIRMMESDLAETIGMIHYTKEQQQNP